MAARKCEFCGDRLPADARPNRKYCSDDCRRGRTKTPSADELGPVTAGTEEAIAEAIKEKRLGAIDAGAIAAIRVLARKIDTETTMREYCLAYADEQKGGARPKPPPMDGVSIPTYLNYCVQLGLVPGGRKGLPGPKEAGGGRKLGGHLAAVEKPTA